LFASPCANLMVFIALTTALLSSCTDGLKTAAPLSFKEKTSTSPESQNALGSDGSVTEGGGQLKLRRARLIRNTLAKALVLDPQGMCLELGRLPCADLVHKGSLGGIDAYNNTQYMFTQDIGVAAAPAMERLALSACIQRASMDLVAPAQAVIFKSIELSVDGRIIDSAAVNVAIDTLYKRLFSRAPVDTEIQALRELYVRVYEKNPHGAARNWMVLACFAVASSAEAFFY